MSNEAYIAENSHQLAILTGYHLCGLLESFLINHGWVPVDAQFGDAYDHVYIDPVTQTTQNLLPSYFLQLSRLYLNSKKGTHDEDNLDND